MKRENDAKPGMAIALRYEGRGAPRVTAKGKGCTADKILELAREHDIPLREDAALAELLAKVELGDEIPPNLYRAVAEVLAFAYLISGKAATLRKYRDPSDPSAGQGR